MFYNLGRKEVLSKLESSKHGLSENEAKRRLREYGYNEIKREHKIHPFKIFISQFFSPLVIILMIAAVISAILGEAIDAIVILIIVIMNAIFGFVQEFKAEKSIELLQKLTVPKCRVIRNGKEKIISSTLLVPGDIIVFEAGDKISADARLVDIYSLQLDESILTGESTAVSKQLAPIGEKVLVSEQTNMVFSGTTVARGRGKAVVVNTGSKTELGKIAKLVQEVVTSDTPLQKKLKKLGEKLAVISLGISALVFVVGILKGLGLFDTFLTAVTLAVAVIPEGLPAVVTISLALGVQRMLKRNALIRKLQAVETLGSTTVICSDKTGTITKNEMTVKKLYANNGFIEVTGSGYSTDGEFLIKNNKIYPERFLHLLNVSASCNNAVLPDIGDPTELALLVLAKKGHVNKIEERVHEIAFDPAKKFMSTTHRLHGDEITFLKGAPEVILNFCNYYELNGKLKMLNKVQKNKFLKVNHDMTLDALRVLGAAYKKNGKTIFTGLIGMIDPPRDEVKDAIELVQEAGVRIIMITGDHKNTAQAIAHEIGLKGGAIEGKEISKSNIANIVKSNNIFARVDPEHKVMILEALQKNGEIVAMTGDGINDAPALKKANIGVAMSIKGTDVARDASDMVLVDDNFSSIVNAVKEGRVIYDNIKKFVKFLLSANLGEIGVVLFSLLLGLPLPLLPLHILWVNLVTDGLPALALGVDNEDKNVMKRKPRPKDETILKGTFWFTIFAGVIGTLVVLGLFYFSLGKGLEEARTIALTTLIFFELFLAFSCRSDISVFKLERNKWLWLAVLSSIAVHLVLLYSSLGSYFKLVPLDLVTWIYIILLSSLGLLLFEVKKLVTHI